MQHVVSRFIVASSELKEDDEDSAPHFRRSLRDGAPPPFPVHTGTGRTGL